MVEFADKPLSFSAGSKWLADKVVLPTDKNTADFALATTAQVRMQVFHSAKVASASVLKEMQRVAQLVAAGDIGADRGREMLKDHLRAYGYDVPSAETGDAKDIRQVGSTSRLNLIISQNVAMANAIAQREVSEHPDVAALFPNYEYSATMDDRTRSEHAKLDGLILPKSHPFWRTHFPPWEFNCRCAVYDTDEPAQGSAKVTEQADGSQSAAVTIGGRLVDVPPNASGFVFSSDPAELGQAPRFEDIADPDLQAEFRRQWEARQKGEPAPEDPAAQRRAQQEAEARRAAREAELKPPPEPAPAPPLPEPTPSIRPSAQPSPTAADQAAVQKKAFEAVTIPLRKKVSYGDTVAFLQNGAPVIGTLAGPDDGNGWLIDTPAGKVRMKLEDLRHPKGFRGAPEN